jgi:acyl-CoA synthetase (AMP-forming)/AMP-acid ligase II
LTHPCEHAAVRLRAEERRLQDVERHRQKAGAILDKAAGDRCTSLYGVPTMFIAELDDPEFGRFDLSSRRTGIMAGSLCPIEVMKQSNRIRS